MSEQILHIPRSMNNTELPKNITIDHFYYRDCIGYGFSTHHAVDSLVEMPYGYLSMLVPYGETHTEVEWINLMSLTKKSKDKLSLEMYEQTYKYDEENKLVCINTQFAERITLWEVDVLPEEDTYAYNMSHSYNVTSPNYKFHQTSAAAKSNPGQLLVACLFVVSVVLGFI